MDWGHFLFGFSGRINRAKYWLWVLIYFVAAIVQHPIARAALDRFGNTIAGGVSSLFEVLAMQSNDPVTERRKRDDHRADET